MPLRLKSLDLQGYKTFASKTTFEFAGNITAIVGPNGSGKSNIADALRWVLGEQSYGLLRAKKTEDMIFSGSESRTRSGMASASILFDNTDGWLPLDFSEVSMGRRAYRDGRNDYLLNSHRVRLREINEILTQSGLSERTYTILGQGLVDASLALKADERRRLFEEAAGVGLYRSRRQETLRRLETTQRNLERVRDIMAELKPRLRSLERQARKAGEYSRVQEDLRVMLREWYGYHWHKYQSDLAESKNFLRRQEKRQQEAQEAYQDIQSEYSAYRENLLDLRSQLNNWHLDLSDLRATRETIIRELAVLDERQRALKMTYQSVETERGRVLDEIELATTRFVEIEKELAQKEDLFQDAQNSLRKKQKEYELRKVKRTEIEKKLQAMKISVSDLGVRRAEVQARLDDLMARSESEDQRMKTSAQLIQKAVDDVSDTEENYHIAEKLRKKAEHELQLAEKMLADKKKAVDLGKKEIQSHNKNIMDLQAEYSRIKAQVEVFEQAEESFVGYAAGTSFLLNSADGAKFKGAHGVLSAALEVPPEYEVAIAAALGESLDAVLLESSGMKQALKLLESGDGGRAALIPVEDVVDKDTLQIPEDTECLGCAADLVKTSKKMQKVVNALLGQTLIVVDRDTARRLITGQPTHVQVVSLKGEVFRGNGLVLAGKSHREAVLSTPRQRRELEEKLVSIEIQQKEYESELQNLNSKLHAAEKALSRAEDVLNDQRARFEESQKAAREAALDVDSAKRQMEWHANQSKAIRTGVTQAEAEKERLRGLQIEIETELQAAAKKAQKLNQKMSEITLDEIQSQVSYWTTRVAVADQSLTDARTRVIERQSVLEKLETKQAELVAQLEDLDKKLGQLEQDRVSLSDREKSLHAEIEELSAKIDPVEKDLADAVNMESKLQQKENNTQHQMTMADRQYNQVQVEVIRRQEALESLRGRIQDDFGLVSFEYRQDVSGPMPLPFDGMVEQLPVIKELSAGLKEQITQQRAQLRRMGPVNPEAQDEYESESERFDFMQEQVEDLLQAQDDLRQVIVELDELTKQEFSKTFSAVDKEFQQIFVRLFGGGSARLALTDPANLVETGIEIEARLPGRREQGLALLSGGERSLTAIALVFALLKVSPTPICVMDEVDAMLDEANVGRFRELLQELSQETQFIIITHNRNTVQAADVIYGITMGRDSSSQVISLRLDEVTEKYVGKS